MGGNTEPTPRSSDQLSLGTDETVPWAVTRTLLDAHAKTSRAFEQYLLLQHLEAETTSEEELKYALEGAITDHQRIIEDLQAVLETVED